jgi:hypothetical protein
MDEVVAADGRAIAVAGHDNDLEAGLGVLDPGGKGQGAAMGGMEGIEVQIAHRPA